MQSTATLTETQFAVGLKQITEIKIEESPIEVLAEKRQRKTKELVRQVARQRILAKVMWSKVMVHLLPTSYSSGSHSQSLQFSKAMRRSCIMTSYVQC